MTAAALGLGANLGDAANALRTAIAGLAADPQVEVTSVSGLWRTAAIGGPEQTDYLNAVALVETSLAPRELLDLAQSLERAAGRRRNVRWGPRTLDVDLLDLEGVRSDDPELMLPHPRAHERAFVLAPWAQVAPDWLLQPEGLPLRPVREWLADVTGQAVLLVDAEEWWR